MTPNLPPRPDPAIAPPSGTNPKQALPPEDQAAARRVAELLRGCQSVLTITGAGVSADSGLPTYRGVGGLYNVNTSEDGHPIETLLSGAMWRRRPDLTWKYLGQVESACRGATFNRAHAVIAEMERHWERAWTLTQNVDGFHTRAGARRVIEIHGNLRRLRCVACAYRSEVEDYAGLELPARCPDCRSWARPDVVLFDEALPAEQLATLTRECARGFDLVLSVGTTSAFAYIAAPVFQAKRRGKPTVEINPGETEISAVVDIRVRQGAAAALDAIWQAYLESA